PRNFELRSDDDEDTWAGTPSPKFGTTPTGGRLATLRTISRATGLMHDGSSMESGFEPRTLRPQSLDHLATTASDSRRRRQDVQSYIYNLKTINIVNVALYILSSPPAVGGRGGQVVGAKRPPVGVVPNFGEGVPAQVSSSSSDRGSKLRGPSQNNPYVASKRDANVTKPPDVGI
ncbi:hypothetical protein AVEN_116794-1, partial [Araneus ventricosus]